MGTKAGRKNRPCFPWHPLKHGKPRQKPWSARRLPMSRRNHRCKRRLYAHCRGARWSNWTPQPARANGAGSFCQTGSPASFPRPPLLGHTAAWGAAARRVSAVMLSARHAPIWARLTGGVGMTPAGIDCSGSVSWHMLERRLLSSAMRA